MKHSQYIRSFGDFPAINLSIIDFCKVLFSNNRLGYCRLPGLYGLVEPVDARYSPLYNTALPRRNHGHNVVILIRLTISICLRVISWKVSELVSIKSNEGENGWPTKKGVEKGKKK